MLGGGGVGAEGSETVTLTDSDAFVVELSQLNVNVYVPAAVGVTARLPYGRPIALPAQPPEPPVAEQFVASVVLQLKVTDWPVAMLNEDAVRLTTTPPGVEAFLVTV